MPSFTIPEIIKKARNGRTQVEFADILSISQSVLSRYESGKANPPIEIIEYCMRLVHISDQPPSADELADKVKSRLNNDNFVQVRLALAQIIDNLSIAH